MFYTYVRRFFDEKGRVQYVHPNGTVSDEKMTKIAFWSCVFRNLSTTGVPPGCTYFWCAPGKIKL